MKPVVHLRRATRGLEAAPPDVAERIRQAFQRLAKGAEPRPDVRRLVARPGFRLRVGKWRAVFRYREDGTIEVIDVRPRGEG